uniref:FimV/HubP family polar landmark protein n=1 Tax=uncultured Psychrobacter sp. TaxID=259303 RepID=UPI00262FF18F|nr:FimV/HubP family polar landmark protein [uncultured Psychrobacter sp.]
MDNMLYIIAGLIIVLLIAVLIMRRQKAQPTARHIDDAQSSTRRVPTDYDAAHTNATAGATKFDNLTVAERFIDQQRYDKAIEVLERGLIQKPHDAKLSLKLLNIYALTTQTENFYRTYDAISAHCDAATIAQAKDLKALFDQEHSQTPIAARDDTHANDQQQAVAADYDSLDFDVASVSNETQSHQQDKFSTSQETAASTDSITDLDFVSSAPSASSFNESTITDDTSSNDSADAIFDLTLDDLESESFDEATANTARNLSVNDSGLDSHTLSLDEQFESDSTAASTPVNDSQESNLISEDFSAAEARSNEVSFDEVSSDNLNLDEDFSLDFDEPAADSLSSETVALQPTDSQNDNLQEDFVLDFDDLASDSPSNSDTGISTDLNTDINIDTIGDSELAASDLTTEEETADVSSFELNLSLDDDNSSELQLDALSLDSLEQTDTQKTVNDNSTLAVEENLSSTASSNSTETLTTELDDFDFDLTDSQPIKNEPSTTETDSPLMFDDETPFEEDFSLDDSIFEDAATTASPVVTEDKADNTDFAAQFAADFDFVNDLDNQQITLDLAAKYLELGEYDSAKRLLSEVIAQGSSAQQAQAQTLLERTV